MKRFVLVGKNGKTCLRLNFSNIGSELEPEKVKIVIEAARFYGRTDTTAESVFEIPALVESFEEYLKRKLADNPKGYRVEWLKKTGYRYLTK